MQAPASTKLSEAIRKGSCGGRRPHHPIRDAEAVMTEDGKVATCAAFGAFEWMVFGDEGCPDDTLSKEGERDPARNHPIVMGKDDELYNWLNSLYGNTPQGTVSEEDAPKVKCTWCDEEMPVYRLFHHLNSVPSACPKRDRGLTRDEIADVFEANGL